MTVLLEYLDQNFHFTMKMLPIMLALCLMPSTYYGQKYAGIIGWSLPATFYTLTVQHYTLGNHEIH